MKRKGQQLSDKLSSIAGLVIIIAENCHILDRLHFTFAKEFCILFIELEIFDIAGFAFDWKMNTA